MSEFEYILDAGTLIGNPTVAVVLVVASLVLRLADHCVTFLKVYCAATFGACDGYVNVANVLAQYSRIYRTQM